MTARIPGWSPLTDPDDWSAFTARVSEELAARGWSVDFETGWGTEGTGRFGLFNVAGTCRRAPRADWPRVVGEHFDAVAATARRSAAGESLSFASADEARATMKARLVSESYLEDAGEYLGRRVADDLMLVVACDLPDSVGIPGRDELLRWGDGDELLALAIEQARAEPGLALERHEIPGSGDTPAAPLFALSGESFFTATHALWAHELDPPPSEHGTLVAVPVRNLVLAHPIRDATMLGMLAPLLSLAQRYHGEGPGSLSPSVYWLRDGELERLEARLDAEGVHLTPSPAFANLLTRL